MFPPILSLQVVIGSYDHSRHKLIETFQKVYNSFGTLNTHKFSRLGKKIEKENQHKGEKDFINSRV